MRYIALGLPPALPDDVLSCFPSHQRLYTTDDGTVLLVRQPTPQPAPNSQRPVGRAACLLNDDPFRIYVPLLMRPCVMQACHSTASCCLGTTRIPRLLERFCCWVGMSICTPWCLRHCPKCQARKSSRLTVRWPVISMSLAEGRGIAVRVDYFAILPVTPRGNTYILPFTDRFTRRADM